MRHVVTLLAPPTNLTGIRTVVTMLGLEPRWLDENRAADLFFDRAPVTTWLDTLRLTCDAAEIDFIAQPVEGREKKLLISDMDSTMINQECIDELADCVGLKAHVAAITERAMNGELDFKEALRERVALLKDLAESELIRVYEQRITFMSGARTLVQTMKTRGAYCLLVSGGFQFFTSRVAQTLGFDAEEANRLEIMGGKLTGRVIEPILDKASKRQALHRICAERHILLAATLAIGDGANDLPMLKDAGLGVAYRAKPVVQAEAKAAITHNDLTALLYAQGIPRKDWVTL
jgi:phosphoserine phosphatase